MNKYVLYVRKGKEQGNITVEAKDIITAFDYGINEMYKSNLIMLYNATEIQIRQIYETSPLSKGGSQ